MIKGLTASGGSTPPRTPTRSHVQTAARIQTDIKSTPLLASSLATGIGEEAQNISIVFVDLDNTSINYNSDGASYVPQDEKLLSNDPAIQKLVIPHFGQLSTLLARPEIRAIIITKGANKSRATRVLDALGVPTERQYVLAFDADVGRLDEHLLLSNPDKISTLENQIREQRRKNHSTPCWKAPYITDLPAELKSLDITPEQFKKVAELWHEMYSPHNEIAKTLHILLSILQIWQRLPGVKFDKIVFCDDDSENIAGANLFLEFIHSEAFQHLAKQIPAFHRLVKRSVTSDLLLPAIITIKVPKSSSSKKVSGLRLLTPDMSYLAQLHNALGISEANNTSTMTPPSSASLAHGYNSPIPTPSHFAMGRTSTTDAHPSTPMPDASLSLPPPILRYASSITLASSAATASTIQHKKQRVEKPHLVRELNFTKMPTI